MKSLLFLLLIVNVLLAHKLNIFISEENNKIFVSSYFASGSSCKNCKVMIYNLKNEILLEAKTDENGEYIIPKPEETILIKVEAIGGHAAQTKYEINKKIKKTAMKRTSTFDNLLQSLIAIFAIFAIFFFLKKVKK